MSELRVDKAAKAAAVKQLVEEFITSRLAGRVEVIVRVVRGSRVVAQLRRII